MAPIIPDPGKIKSFRDQTGAVGDVPGGAKVKHRDGVVPG